MMIVTWRDLDLKLAPELERLAPKSGPKCTGSALLRLQAETRTVVNQAVRNFCETGDWGKLSGDELTALCHRLDFACGLLKLLQGPRALKDDWPMSEPKPRYAIPSMIEWILVDAWELYELPKQAEGETGFSQN